MLVIMCEYYVRQRQSASTIILNVRDGVFAVLGIFSYITLVISDRCNK